PVVQTSQHRSKPRAKLAEIGGEIGARARTWTASFDAGWWSETDMEGEAREARQWAGSRSRRYANPNGHEDERRARQAARGQAADVEGLYRRKSRPTLPGSKALPGRAGNLDAIVQSLGREAYQGTVGKTPGRDGVMSRHR